MNIGALMLDILLLVLSFGAMHIVSERYFIESLDYLSKKMRLSSDMAGSTLMAAGSSAPELAVALFAVFMKGHHEAIGVGTIVGSALFNILVITGVVMYIRKSSKLIWQPIFRDIVFYIIAILLLAYTFHNGEISLLSGVLLVGAYIAYVIVVYFWKRIFPYDDIENEPEKKAVEIERKEGTLKNGLLAIDSFLMRFQIIVFIFSIGLISFLSWVLVHSAVGISDALGIPELLIGITIVAVGTSVPDLISSVIVAKQGRPGMAINNAIGSNTFDILIGLGLPFLLYVLIFGEGFTLLSDDLLFSVIILMGSAILLLMYFGFSRWKTSKAMGYFLIGLYVLYVIYIICSIVC